MVRRLDLARQRQQQSAMHRWRLRLLRHVWSAWRDWWVRARAERLEGKLHKNEARSTRERKQAVGEAVTGKKVAQVVQARMYMHPCTHTPMHPCTHAHTHTRAHAHMHSGTHAHMHTCTRARMHVCTRAPMHPCTLAPLHLCTLDNFARWKACTLAPLHVRQLCTLAHAGRRTPR